MASLRGWAGRERGDPRLVYPQQRLPPFKEDNRPAGRELVGVVTFSHSLQHLYVGVLPLIYPLAVAEFHVSYTALGLLLGAVGVVGGLLQAAAAFYQRVAARLVLSLQNVSLAATLVMIALAPSFLVFGAGRFLGALFSSPQHPVGNAVLARNFPQRRAAVLSWHTTGGNIGTLAVPLLASVLIARFGWRVALMVFAVPIAAGAIVVWLRLRDRSHDSRRGEGAVATVSLRQVLTRRSTWAIMLAGTIAAGGRGLGTINAYVPAYLHTGLGLPQVTVGAVYTVVLVGSVVGPVVAGYVADRYGRRRIALFSYLSGAVVVALFGMVHGLAGLAVVGALMGMLAFAESPLLQALFSDAVQGAPQQAAFGWYFAVSYGAGSVWIAVLGATIDRWGFAPTFWLMGASFLAAAAMLLLARQGDVPTASPGLGRTGNAR